MDRELIRCGALCELARRDFWEYCKLKAPDFYREDRPYLKTLCRTLQAFVESEKRVLVLCLPPRHGKSRTLTMLAQWLFGRDPVEKIMTGSYNEILSTSFAKAVRDGIAEEKFSPDRIVYSDIFPGVRIKYGEAAASRWALDGQYASYLATSPSGTATGFGARKLIIDDLIKNAEEANNEALLEKQWTWFTDTMLSRAEKGYQIIICMTRWASGDLAGRAMEHWPDAEVINMPAMGKDGTMLCEGILPRDEYEEKLRTTSREIALANYQQQPIDLEGCLYSGFKTYTTLPADEKGSSLLTSIYSYTDTADEGDDWLCSIVWGVYNHEAYVLDLLFTRAPMEETEPAAAKMLDHHKAARARIEGNNGGSGFARSVDRELKALSNYYTQVTWFHQSKNKQARILSNATWVMQHIYFPANWADRWPEYYEAMRRYQRAGKNQHDDAPDATTGVAETMLLYGEA